MTTTTEKVGAGKAVPGIIVALNGANLVAEAMRQTNPDVVAAYPITPQTLIVERFSQFVADGLVSTELITVESEHSAMSACIGAAAAGGRVQTATTSAGLAYMWELLWVAAGTRLPIVMHFVNRALSAPLNIHCDHADSMGARDTGWIQLYAETGQEAYDNALQAVRIAEHPEILTPVLHTQDGFVLSHAVERAEVLPDDAARRFLGEYQPAHSLLDTDHPYTVGPLDPPEYYFEHKRQQMEGMQRALEVIADVAQEYGRVSGRTYGLVEPYRLEDAQVAVVVLGSTAGTSRVAVDALRTSGAKVGLLRVRCMRPFPATAVAEALQDVRAVAVMDRSVSFGAQGNPLFLEVCTALLTHGLHPRTLNYVYGLGGRDIKPREIEQVYRDLLAWQELPLGPQSTRFVGLRG